MLIFSLWASFSLRLGEWYLPTQDVFWLIVAAPLIAIPIFYVLGLYRAIVRYIGFLAIWSVAKAISLYSLAWGSLVFLSGTEEILPRSVIIINWILAMLLIGSSRMIARWSVAGVLHFGHSNKQSKEPGSTSVVIYGAGDAGIQLASALAYSSELSPVAFLDDDEALQHQQINSLNVHPLAGLGKLIEDYEVAEVFIAMPSISRKRRNEVLSLLEPYGVKVRTLPGVADLAQGRVTLDDLREISIDDLLGRDAVPPDDSLLHASIRDKVVMVTGAGGSIGSELCRQILMIKPARLILFELNEYALYSIEKELVASAGGDVILPVLGNVANQALIERVCRTFKVDTIYHAAANKHVPMVEKNILEGCRNNVIGTKNCAQGALNTGVETFVLVSTDKAVRPTNTMGATKRLAEMTLQAIAADAQISGHKTKFSMVRFGNVMGSSGSVIPLFKDQIAKGGPVTVTHPDMLRYFMTIPEAAQLVIQAGAMGEGGDVFVLDMGEPVRIFDLAKRMIRLSGREILDDEHPYGDISIEFSGLRPGEKLYEGKTTTTRCGG